MASRKTLYAYFEAWSPLGAAVAALIVLIYFRPEIIEFFVSNKLSLSQMYTAIFGWASVMTGFQFGVYGLIFSKTDGFISKINNTKSMETFMSYTYKAVILGFCLTILGFPLLVMDSKIDELSNAAYWMGSIYVALFICSFAATVRVAKLFASMARVKPKTRLPA